MNTYRKECSGRRPILFLAVAIAAIAITCCSGDMGELQSYIAEVKSRKGGPVEPLPQVTPYETFVYAAEALRSPFMLDVPGNPNDSLINAPDPDRPREFLEEFPLDSLKMVGTMARAGSTYGLLQTTNGLIHRVKVNDHIGQNDGQIIEINGSEIRLIEIVPDGIGGYLERPAAVALEN